MQADPYDFGSQIRSLKQELKAINHILHDLSRRTHKNRQDINNILDTKIIIKD